MVISINEVNGNGNVIGMHNTVNNMNLSHKNDIIISEAQNFAFRNKTLSRDFNGHAKLIELLQRELYRFYDVESKVIFLNEVYQKIENQRNEHNKMCKKGQDCQIDVYYKKSLFFIAQEMSVLPKIIQQQFSTQSSTKTSVFISYSHIDKAYLDDLKRHFKPIENIVDFWDDNKIRPGQKWKEEIAMAIDNARIVILFISADFFNSEFISSHELPKLLHKANTEGTTIFTVFLKPCMYEMYSEIMDYQGINDPKVPVSTLSEHKREELWVDLVRQVRSIAV